MKRILSLVLAALMLLTCISAMASCSSEEPQTEAKTEEKTQDKTKESSTAAKSSAPASTAAKPAPSAPVTTNKQSAVVTTVSPAAPASSTVTSAPRPVEKPAGLPADLADLELVSVPALDGTAWVLTGGKMMGEVITEDLLVMMGAYYLAFDKTDAAFITDYDLEEGTLQVYPNYILLSGDIAEDGETIYGVFTMQNGALTLAIAANNTPDTVMYLVQADPAEVPTPDLSDDDLPENDELWDDEVWDEYDVEIPEVFYTYTPVNPTKLMNTSWELDSMTYIIDDMVTNYSKEEVLALVGEMSASFTDFNNATMTNELEGTVGTTVTVVDAQNGIMMFEYDNEAPAEYAMLTEIDGTLYLMVGAELEYYAAIVLLTQTNS